jgi:hypothetical protein
MGLDIFLSTTNHDDLYQEEEPLDYLPIHSLSRSFCNLMMRRHTMDAGEESELEQVGRLAQVDVAPLYAMETYPEEMESDWRVESAASEGERQAILHHLEMDKANLEGNLETVRATVEALLDRLSVLPALATHLTSSWEQEAYFSDFTQDPGDGYIDNNLGQDLRNFKRFLEYAKAHGSTTVYFRYE